MARLRYRAAGKRRRRPVESRAARRLGPTPTFRKLEWASATIGITSAALLSTVFLAPLASDLASSPPRPDDPFAESGWFAPIAEQVRGEGSRADGAGGVPVVDWDAWSAANPDIVAWIHVPGTHISHPVAQAPSSDPLFYLDHDAWGRPDPAGCPYLDAVCAAEGLDAQHVVISGHNMGWSDRLFADFSRYADIGFARDHRTVYLLSRDEVRVLSVFGARTMPGSNPEKLLRFSDGDAFSEYLATVREGAAFVLNEDEAHPATRQLFTFCTCSYRMSPENERTLVYAQPA